MEQTSTPQEVVASTEIYAFIGNAYAEDEAERTAMTVKIQGIAGNVETRNVAANGSERRDMFLQKTYDTVRSLNHCRAEEESIILDMWYFSMENFTNAVFKSVGLEAEEIHLEDMAQFVIKYQSANNLPPVYKNAGVD